MVMSLVVYLGGIVTGVLLTVLAGIYILYSNEYNKDDLRKNAGLQ